MTYKTDYRLHLGDHTTPVNLYLAIRNRYADAKLLECSKYQKAENSHSYIVANELESFSDMGHENVVDSLHEFIDNINCDAPEEIQHHLGVFGYTAFEAVSYFDTINSRKVTELPLVNYGFYRFIFVFNHFNNTIKIIENCPVNDKSELTKLEQILAEKAPSSFPFSVASEESVSISESDFKQLVKKVKHHCQVGDVFQLVLSRRFIRKYSGDDFTLYRALRSINPSPYLFYFDYGNFRLIGSSPEAQLAIKNGVAEIHPIAGTYKRTGNRTVDNEARQQLLDDPKESSEHIMLVDLARNDLSQNTSDVHVAEYKQVQEFSHVIHLVSKVLGKVEFVSPYRVFANTFPAGTLSGAPKHKALELINDYEPVARGFYGGAIGMIGLHGNLNHAIMIRTFYSCKGELHYQAGAGIVIDSDEENELQEVNNKLAALRKAICMAETL